MSINEITFGLEALRPHLFELRFIVLAIGITLLVHTYCMAGFMPPSKTPWLVVIPLGCVAGAACGMIVGALKSDLPLILLSSLGATAAWGLMSLVLWTRGLRISEFLKEQKT